LRETDAGTASVQQPGAKVLLYCCNGLGDRWLRQMHISSCSADALRAGGLAEGVQVSQVEGHRRVLETTERIAFRLCWSSMEVCYLLWKIHETEDGCESRRDLRDGRSIQAS
jgi:hypothetical protein